MDFSESESSSVEFLYYWDGFQVVHYWLSSPSARGLRDVTLTAADIDPPPLPPPPPPLITPRTPSWLFFFFFFFSFRILSKEEE